MRTKKLQLFYLLIIGVLILSACNMPGNTAAETTPTEPATQTAAATATFDLAATQTHEAELLITDTPTVTPTKKLISTITATVTPEPPIAEVGRESNCREGPGGVYKLVATYQTGQMLEVVAKDLGGGYWFVKNPEKPEEQCYLLGNNITITGDTSALPKYTPQPSPTAAPYFNVTFKKFDRCEGQDFALFDVVNAGSVAFRSHYIRITDQKAGKTVEQVLNAFDLRVGCVLAKNIAPLEIGGAGYISSPVFTWNALANKLQAVIMLCTEKDLKGTCVTQSLLVDE